MYVGFPGGSEDGQKDLILGLGRSPGGENGYPLQYSCLETFHGQRSLAGYSPWGHRESEMTELLTLSLFTQHTQ